MTEQPKATLSPKDVYDAFNSKDMDRFASILADDYFFEKIGSEWVDKAGFLDFIRKSWEAFPDGRITGIRNYGEGNEVAGEATYEGTHQGNYMGIPGTGKRVGYPFVELFEFQGAKVKSMRVYTDTVTVVRQIGAVPIGFLVG